MAYTELKKEYVIETLAKGTTVIVCDFNNMKMQNCNELTVKSINTLIAKDTTVFFKGVNNES